MRVGVGGPQLQLFIVFSCGHIHMYARPFMVNTIHSSKGLLSNSETSDRRELGAAVLTSGNKKSSFIISSTLYVLWHALWEVFSWFGWTFKKNTVYADFHCLC